jgi:hypothetical protein
MSMEDHYYGEKHNLQGNKMHETGLREQEIHENLDKCHIEIKNQNLVLDSSQMHLEEQCELEISAAWLHDKINPSRWTKIGDEIAKAENHMINKDWTIQTDDYISKLHKEIEQRENSEERPTSTPKISEESSKTKNHESETNFLNEADFEIKDETESHHSSLVGTIKSDVYSEDISSLPKNVPNLCDLKDKTKNKNVKKSIRKRVAKEVTKQKLVEETKRNLRIPIIRSKPQPAACVRKRTKLRSSGESSSAEPMDLSKRRDVVNKTILRVVRRFFSNKFKESLPHKYQNR